MPVEVTSENSQSWVDKLRAELSLILTLEHPRKEYVPRDVDSKSGVLHWGQRKLLLSEIMFMTKYGHLCSTVLYVGAAPGSHIPYLSQLFPTHHFILVDPNQFTVKKSEKITIINEYFTDKMATKFALKDEYKELLFICDMRTADHRQMSFKENEKYVLKDNATQIKWVKQMKPLKSMLKFRCQYPATPAGKSKGDKKEKQQDGGSTTPLLKGDIYIQVWPGASSTETRLIVDGTSGEFEESSYDDRTYEEQLFYHNTVTRVGQFAHPVKADGLDQRFDSAAEVLILAEYLETFPQHLKGDLATSIARMSGEISKSISPQRTLSSKLDPVFKRQFPKSNHTVFYGSK